MMLRTVVFTICCVLGSFHAWGETEMIIRFSKGDKVEKTKRFKFSIYSSDDTIIVFNSANYEEIKRSRVFVRTGVDTIRAAFEYCDDFEKWHSVEYLVTVETGTKRIEIEICFSTNSKKVEYVQDFIVDKFYSTNRVSIQPVFKKQIGEQPMFMIVSNCDTAFWGRSSSNHFYGTLKFKTDYGWKDIVGSYCSSTVPENSLHKYDTAYSWVPSYSSGSEYKIKERGTYRYTVVMGLEEYTDVVPIILVEQGQTRKRTRVFYELETEFVVE